VTAGRGGRYGLRPLRFAYSTAEQRRSSSPYSGKSSQPARSFIDTVSLVIEWGPERLWGSPGEPSS
jgi:hypothetical protein